tara:strand:- start:550 stop:894 length:345 start_codon:yes stop_codon:yes gene_type:complete
MAYYGQNAVFASVSFNGTNTSSIYDSYNVSSIGDNANGQFKINFSTSADNSNYVPLGLSQRISGYSNIRHFCWNRPGTHNQLNTSGFDFAYVHYENESAQESDRMQMVVITNTE